MNSAAALACAVCLSAVAANRAYGGELPSGPDEMAWRLFAQANAQRRSNDKPAWLREWTEKDNLSTNSDTPLLNAWRKAGHHPDIQNMLHVLQTVKERGRLLSQLRKLIGATGEPNIQSYYNPPLARKLRAPLNGDPNATLSTRAGRQAAFKNGQKIDLGSATVAVKAQFQVVRASEGSQYYLVPPSDNNYAVVAFHLTSRILDQWLWATWEPAPVAAEDQQNKGYCCKDSFGWDTAAQKPTPQLLRLLRQAKVDDAWGRNYRLVGTQVYAADSTGKDIKLGNYYLEVDHYATSSCVTCHARAAFDAHGDPPSQDDGHGHGYTGEPCNSWFEMGGKLTHLQLDFLWTNMLDRRVEELLQQLNIDLFAL